MPAVTIDGKLLGRIVHNFASLAAAFDYVGGRCVQRGKVVDCTVSIGAVPEWGLPIGGTYQFTLVPDAASGKWAGGMTLISEP